MPTVTDIPVDVLLDNVLPSVPVTDLLHLGSTNHFFSTLVSDELFWKRKLEQDFNFSGAGTARTSGWKFIYRGLSRPKIFVWGEKSQGRLGMTKVPHSYVGDVPFPTEIHIPGVRIVSLIAGGMSFHAIGSKGELYVWGAIDGTSYALEGDGFSEPGKQASTPLKLDLPTPTKSLSCGRLHSSSIDVNNSVWIFTSWGRPFRLVSPLIDNTSRDSTPIQVECGWTFTSVLTQSGDVLMWWPGGRMLGPITLKTEEMDREGDKKACATDDGIIPCVTWELNIDPVRLPALPTLPRLSHIIELKANEDPRLIQIAGLDNVVIGLTQHGHVLKLTADDEMAAEQSSWVYLPMFSEVDKVRAQPAFSPQDSPVENRLEAPQVMHITHISGNYETFIAYSTGSSSIVLMGKTDTDAETAPIIIPTLQNRNVISVVLGDYHFGALTSTGKLYTWGQFSRGALGLGDPCKIEAGKPGGFVSEEQRLAARERRRHPTPPAVTTPTEVRFDHRKKKPRERFCFAATAAGWHMGALVIDLDPDDDDEESAEEEEVTGDQNTPRPNQPFQSLPPFLLGSDHVQLMPIHGAHAFRIGFAGRGAHRGQFGTGRGSG